MRYLKLIKSVIKINDKFYDLKFTLDVIDKIQDITELPITQIVARTMEKATRKSAVQILLKYLVGQEIEDNDNEFGYYSAVLLNTYIDQLKTKPIPEQKKVENVENEYDFFDIERMVYIGTTVLGYQEQDVWEMTPGKIGTLHNQHLRYNDRIFIEKEVSIDEAIPM